MDPISNPKGTYRHDPPGRRPDKCPQCDCVLEHFHASSPAKQAPEAQNAKNRASLSRPEPFVTPIDLLSEPTEEPQTAAQEPAAAFGPDPLPESVEVGDFALSEPEFARATEMQIAKAKKKRQMTSSAKAAASSKPADMSHPHRDALKVLDDPKIGGKVTICVLLFGDHHNLHRRCLASIVNTTPPSRMDLRVATNQVCLDTKNYLNSLPISHVYDNTKVRRKYSAMREMFHDKKRPIETEWVIWFDDDSYARKQNWLIRLGQAICEVNDPTVTMLGVKMLHPLKSHRRDPRQWFRNASWWQNKHFCTRQGKEAPNGNTIHFIVGGFWALRTSAIRDCDIPDSRLSHNGGDIVIGEQLHQNGYKIKLFNQGKELIHTSASPRRGFSETFPFYL